MARWLTLRAVATVLAAASLAAVAGFASPADEPPVCDTGGPYRCEVLTESVFDARGSYDPDGEIIIYFWDFGDDSTDYGETVTHVYYNEGNYIATLCITDNGQHIECCETDVTVVPRAAAEGRTWGSVKALYR